MLLCIVEATGKHIIAHTAAGIMRTQMKLGGKVPVSDDAGLQYGGTWVDTHVMFVSEMLHDGQKLSE